MISVQEGIEPEQVLGGTRVIQTKIKGCRNVRGLPLHQRKLFRNLARQTPRVQGLTFDHNQIRWISYWKNEQNKQVQKHFPVSRYGFFGARKLALEERNRVQGWPLDTDEASMAIERLKVDAAAFGGREDGTTGSLEDSQPMETDEENPTVPANPAHPVTESALMRAMREDDEEGLDRPSISSSITRRRGNRNKPAKRGLNASTQTERSSPSVSFDRERSDGSIRTSETRHVTDETAFRTFANHPDFLNRAYTGPADQKPLFELLKSARCGTQSGEAWSRPFSNDELLEALIALAPGRAVPSVYLEAGTDRRQVPSTSRLISIASTTFEEPEPLCDVAPRDDERHDPDPLRDLINCVVSRPVDAGVDWDAEVANRNTVVDVSRPTRNPVNSQPRHC